MGLTHRRAKKPRRYGLGAQFVHGIYISHVSVCERGEREEWRRGGDVHRPLLLSLWCGVVVTRLLVSGLVTLAARRTLVHSRMNRGWGMAKF